MRNLLENGIVQSYAPLSDIKGSYTAQWEHVSFNLLRSLIWIKADFNDRPFFCTVVERKLLAVGMIISWEDFDVVFVNSQRNDSIFNMAVTAFLLHSLGFFYFSILQSQSLQFNLVMPLLLSSVNRQRITLVSQKITLPSWWFDWVTISRTTSLAYWNLHRHVPLRLLLIGSPSKRVVGISTVHNLNSRILNL